MINVNGHKNLDLEKKTASFVPLTQYCDELSFPRHLHFTFYKKKRKKKSRFDSNNSYVNCPQKSVVDYIFIILVFFFVSQIPYNTVWNRFRTFLYHLSNQNTKIVGPTLFKTASEKTILEKKSMGIFNHSTS